jgi:hypothetical protein
LSAYATKIGRSLVPANIVYVWGGYLEHTGAFRYLFGINIPESLLPYPIEILQGAFNKMEAHYFKHGHHDRVKLLEGTEAMLMQYTDDEEAIQETVTQFGNKKWQEAFIPGLKIYQKTQADAGFLVDKKLWKLSSSRIEELLK